jgi:prolyl-tRNA synthetase
MSKKLPKRTENYSEWYQELVLQADLAEHSAVSGCMVIKPYGYAIWERMQQILDQKFKETGHQNAYFPLFIPKSFLSKEAQHVEGFAKECAVVTHHRLKNAPHGKGVIVDPDAKLEEELIVRPTSETIIWHTYKKWIQSYRDLPLLINQWANVVRWEMRTRLFLRTTEFLWQEGHTAHATAEEAIAEAQQMLNVYADFVENTLSIPVIKGVKTENERFAGAVETYCIEAMMQDGKALQAGTSHFLGQNFAKAFDVQFLNKQNQLEYVWATSWGVSTRLMGALIMSHSDDDGLILPPSIAPIQIVLVPIYKSEEEQLEVIEKLRTIAQNLKNEGFRIKLDDDDTKRPGWKFAEWELKGVPLRLALGPKDLKNHQIEVFRRDTKEKSIIPIENLVPNFISMLLNDVQKNLFTIAQNRLKEKTVYANTYEEFQQALEHECFVMAHWDGTTETELLIKEETKATIRCIPLNNPLEDGKCIKTGKPSKQRVLFARAY